MIRYTKESPGVFVIPLYQASSCRSIVEYLKDLKGSSDWTAAQVRGATEDRGYYTAVRPDVRSASVLVSPDAATLFSEFDDKMNRIIKPLVQQMWRVRLTEHSGTQLIRYTSGGHYIAHQDAGTDAGNNRYFSVVCYLNEDFEGGQTRFPSLNYSATPKCGKAVLFPATYFHCAEPVIDGEKYVWVTWIVGPAPIDWI